MSGYLHDALLGWSNYKEGTKLPALLLGILLLFWLTKRWREQKTLFLYSSVATALCMTPPLAAILMLYQTRFYEYFWLWNLVPMNLIIAYAVTALGGEILSDKTAGRAKKAAMLAMVLAVVLLSGGTKHTAQDVKDHKEERRAYEAALGELTARVGEDMYLWAPAEILQYARAYSGQIRVLYGRNMWDNALNAYAYDSYDEETVDQYLWIQGLCENGRLDQEKQEGLVCIRGALEKGVDVILLPGNTREAALKKIKKEFGIEPVPLAGYYLLATGRE